MRRHRNVKIVATLGPASNNYEMIRALVEAGADVFRLNMSHGDHAEIRVRHAIIRKVEEDLDTPIGILADLQGPKLRVGVCANGEEELVKGAAFRSAPRTSKSAAISRSQTFFPTNPLGPEINIFIKNNFKKSFPWTYFFVKNVDFLKYNAF